MSILSFCQGQKTGYSTYSLFKRDCPIVAGRIRVMLPEADSRNSGREDLNPRPSSKQGRPARRNHKPHGVFPLALKSLPEGWLEHKSFDIK